MKNMRMKALNAPILLAAFGIALAACGGGYDAPAPQEPPPPPPAAVNFTTFVNDQFAATADDTDPAAVDETDFEFMDDENPDAFSDLLDNP